MSVRALVTGARGTLGRAVARSLGRPGWHVAALAREELDLRDDGQVRALVRDLRPAVVVNCAALADVDACERAPAEALAVNRDAAAGLARAAHGVGALVVHLSTDYVFDGRKERPYREEDAPNPLSAYGRSKLEGERAVAAANPRHLVVRTAWLFGAEGRNFNARLLERFGEEDPIPVVVDQRGSPTRVESLAAALSTVVERALVLGAAAPHGLYHCAGQGSATRAELARAMLEEARRVGGVRTRGLVEVAARDTPGFALRPRATPLDSTRIWRAFGVRLPDWREDVRELVAGAWGRA